MTLFVSLVGTRCMDRWDEGSWDTIPLGTEGSLPWLIRGKTAFIEQNQRMLYSLYPSEGYSVQDTRYPYPFGSAIEVFEVSLALQFMYLPIDVVGKP